MVVHSSKISTRGTPIDRVSVDGIVVRLAGVRRGIRNRVVVAGLARVLWLVFAWAAADLLIDWTLRLDRSQRAVLLALFCSFLVWYVYRWLVKPLVQPVSDDALALAVEAANPQLGQSLITALQLSRFPSPSPSHPPSQPAGASTALMQRTITSAVKLADEVSFGSVFESGNASRNAGVLAAAVVCLIALTAAYPFSPHLRTWFSRNVLLSRASWPQQTYLTIERMTDAGTVVFPRGGDWTQTVEIAENSTVVPDAAYLDLREIPSGKRSTSLVMERLSERRFESTFQKVMQPFEFRAKSGDAVSDWVRVELVDPPALRDITITIVSPKYSGQGPEPLLPGQSVYPLLHGSSLKITAKTNKPLASAALVHHDKRWPLQMSKLDQSNRLSGEITASDLVDGSYSIELVDTFRLSSLAADFTFRWLKDKEPSVTARLDGIGNLILPQARIPIRCEASDDYGLTSLSVTVVFATGGTDDEPQKRLMSLMEPGALGNLGQPTDHRDASVSQSLDIEPLQLPIGANLRLQLEASDNNNVTGPGVGRSAEFFLRVVSEAEFRSDLLRREKAERQELEQLGKAQDDLVTDSRALVAAVNKSSSTNSAQLDQLQLIYRGQKQIGPKLAAIADRLAGLAAEIENNRLPDSAAALQTRLARKIAEPLRELASRDVTSLVQALDRSRQAAQSSGKLDLAQAIAGQEAIAGGIKRALDQMITSEGYQEAIDLLYEIQKAQSEVHAETNKAREEQVKRILEGRG